MEGAAVQLYIAYFLVTPYVYVSSQIVSEQEAFEKCWAHLLLRAAVTLPVTRCR